MSLAPLPNGAAQTFTSARQRVGVIVTEAQDRCGHDLSSLATAVSSAEGTVLSALSSFGASFTEIKTYATASSATDVQDVDEFVGGLCRLMREAADGTLFVGLLDAILDLEDTLGINGGLPNCSLVHTLRDAVDAVLSELSGLVSSLNVVANQLKTLLTNLTQRISQLMMMVGGEMGILNAMTDCFAAAAVYNSDVAKMYNTVDMLQTGLSDGTISNNQLAFFLKTQAREHISFDSGMAAIKSGLTATALEEAISGYVAAKAARNAPAPEAPAEPETGYTDLPPAYDFSADRWIERVSDWEWQDTNSLQLAATTPRDDGVVLYDDISRPNWQGTLDIVLQSLEDHRRAAGLILGRNAEGQFFGILKRGSNGLGTYVFDTTTLETPVGYEPSEDHSSAQTFDAWIDIPGVELKLVADDTYLTVMAREVQSDVAYDMLQVARADLATIEIGLITLGEGMQFHLRNRTDD